MALPNPPQGPWTSSSSPGYSIHSMPLHVYEALEAGDLERASTLAPVSVPPLPPFLISEPNRGIWRRRLAMVAADPDHLPWVLKVIIFHTGTDPETGRTSPAVLVGRIGFHGKPDAKGLVEVGYEIDSAQRRRGHAGAAMRIIADVAKRVQGVNVLRAGVAEENFISRRVVESVGLRKVGVEMHERRGLEDVFLLDVGGSE